MGEMIASCRLRQAIVKAIRNAYKNRGHAAALRHIERDLLVLPASPVPRWKLPFLAVVRLLFLATEFSLVQNTVKFAIATIPHRMI